MDTREKYENVADQCGAFGGDGDAEPLPPCARMSLATDLPMRVGRTAGRCPGGAVDFWLAGKLRTPKLRCLVASITCVRHDAG